MPALVKSSFTEALLVVLECTDAVIHSKVSGRKSACIALLSHDLERFKHDGNFVQVLPSPAVLQL